MDTSELKRRAGIVTEDDGSARRKEMVRKALSTYVQQNLEGKITTARGGVRTPEKDAKVQRLEALYNEYDNLLQSIDSWFTG